MFLISSLALVNIPSSPTKKSFKGLITSFLIVSVVSLKKVEILSPKPFNNPPSSNKCLLKNLANFSVLSFNTSPKDFTPSLNLLNIDSKPSDLYIFLKAPSEVSIPCSSFLPTTNSLTLVYLSLNFSLALVNIPSSPNSVLPPIIPLYKSSTRYFFTPENILDILGTSV